MIPNQEAKDIIDKLKINPFIDGPTEAIVKAVAQSIHQVPEFRYIFRENIETYERTDFSEAQLPALCVYNKTYRKEQESHYINGEVLLDIIWPPMIRRAETQNFQDVLSAALVQQFRRPNYYLMISALVPGLNELGKVFDVDKTLGLQWDDGFIPVTRMKANFRIDLKRWDDYLESTGRTKEDPFNVTLGNLKTIAGKILPVLDGIPPETDTVDLEVTIKGGS